MLLFPAMSRWAVVVALAAFPYVRSQGLGSPFHQDRAEIATLVAALTALAAAFLLAGFAGLGLFVGVAVLAAILGWAMTSALGGMTGDTYGATNEIIEVAGLVASVALLPHGWIEPLWRTLNLIQFFGGGIVG